MPGLDPAPSVITPAALLCGVQMVRLALAPEAIASSGAVTGPSACSCTLPLGPSEHGPCSAAACLPCSSMAVAAGRSSCQWIRTSQCRWVCTDAVACMHAIASWFTTVQEYCVMVLEAYSPYIVSSATWMRCCSLGNMASKRGGGCHCSRAHHGQVSGASCLVQLIVAPNSVLQQHNFRQQRDRQGSIAEQSHCLK